MPNDFDISVPIIKVPKITVPKVTPIKISDPLAPWSGKEREKIPPKVRKAVWEKRFATRKTGKCYVCGRPIYNDDFHCAHKRAAARGGSIRVTNLEPTCARCNLKMGTQDLEIYKRKNFPSLSDNPTPKKTAGKATKATSTPKKTTKSPANKQKKTTKPKDPWDVKLPDFKF
ncbi:MAG: hypothetical protein CVV31_06605 [Methanomicrobiales archaeon HGW-Methanomicrobiales-2]|jgi:5-methylcytosine-specific restriction endonuclease McrA|nr:MAG: hypothetical protein CVV31_06605 [Methanomicrobiales archaeon HGW-Methanomicrobiales-2]